MSRAASSFALPAAVALLAAGCTEFNVQDRKVAPTASEPVIDVQPDLLEFGELSSAQVGTQSVTITNTGFAVLELTELELVGPESYEVVFADPLPLDLERDESTTFEVVFQPEEGGDLLGTVWVRSNASNAEEVPVDLVGTGALSDLEITPDPMVFGEAFIPCDAEQAFTLTNVGNEPLEVQTLDLLDGGSGQFALAFEPMLPLELQPGASFELPVVFDPTVPGDAAATLDVGADDPQGKHSAGVSGRARHAATYTEQFEVQGAQAVDIMFLVDQSCSMDGESAILGQEFSSFINTVSGVTQGWKIGVVTNDNGCFNSGILTAQTPNVQSTFSSAVSLGFGGSYTESLLQLAEIAMGQDYGGCNNGFRSLGAPLHVVFVSDERDQSDGYSNGWSVNTTYHQSYLSYYNAYAVDPSLFTAHAIVDLYNTCGGSSWDDEGPGGYLQLANLTGGETLDICSTNWSSQLTQIAAQAVAGLDEYELSEPFVDPNSLQVWIDGVLTPTGWTFDPVDNGVDFDVELDDGQVIDVSYGVMPGNCP